MRSLRTIGRILSPRRRRSAESARAGTGARLADAIGQAARDIPAGASTLDVDVIREWLSGAKLRLQSASPVPVGAIALLDYLLVDLTTGRIKDTQPERIGEAILRADCLWHPSAAATIPVNAVRLIAGRVPGPTGEALSAILDLLRNRSDVGAASRLKNVVTANALHLREQILGLMIEALIQQPGEAQHLANHLFHHGDKRLAAELCRRIVGMGHTFRDTYLILALAEAASDGDREPTLELGLLHCPDDQVLLIELAKIRRERGDLDAAADLALRACKQEEVHPDVLSAGLAILVAADRLAEAIAHGVKLGDGAQSLPLLCASAGAALQAKQYSTALQYARRAHELDRKNAVARHIVLVAVARLWGRSDDRALAFDILQNRSDAAAWRAFVHARLQFLNTMHGAAQRAAIEEFAAWTLSEFTSVARDLVLRLVGLAILAGLDEPASALIRRLTRDGEIAVHEALPVAEAIRIAGRLPASGFWTAKALSDVFQSAVSSPPVGRSPSAPTALLLIAASLDTGAPAACLNAGLAELCAGRVDDAERQFNAIQSRDSFPSGRIRWPLPTARGAWPKAPVAGLDAAFERRLGGAAWPRITLLTSSYNQGRFVEEAILSILNQNYPNLEYIVIDAGSNDETGTILERYRDRISEIFVFEGMSQTAALNFGFARASGDILGWLNTDDILLPGALHAMAAAYVESGADVLMGDCVIFRDQQVECLVTSERDATELQEEALLDIYHNWLFGGFILQPEVMISRKAFERVGSRLDESLNYTMDYDLWVRLARARASRISIAWPIAGFRKHRDQKTSDEFACFTELRQVRDRYAGTVDEELSDAPATYALAQDNAEIQLCLWDRPAHFLITMPPIGESTLTMPDGRTVRLVLAEDLKRGSPFTIHLFGLGGGLPGQEQVREALEKTASPSVAWIWNAASHFVEKRRVSECFDIVIPADPETGAYLARRTVLCPALPQATIALTDQEPFDKSLEERRPEGRTRRCGYVSGVGAAAPDATGQAPGGPEDGVRIDRLLLDELAAISSGDRNTYIDLLARYDVLLIRSAAGEIPHLACDAMLAGSLPVLLVDEPAPIVRRSEDEPEVERVRFHDEADLPRIARESLAKFDEAGAAGVAARRQAVADGHSLGRRIEQILAALG